MNKKDIVIIADYTQSELFTQEELCITCRIPQEFLQELLAYEVIHPQSSAQGDITFNITHLERIKTARRLHQDLEINIAGIALALDLIDQLEELREKMALLERHYK